MRDERGSSTVEFVLVGSMLTILTVLVLQLGIALFVRNIVHDAAIDGAYAAARADAAPGDAERAVRDALSGVVGPTVIQTVNTRAATHLGHLSAEVRVTATLPLVGLLGFPSGMEVTAYAPQQSLDVE